MPQKINLKKERFDIIAFVKKVSSKINELPEWARFILAVHLIILGCFWLMFVFLILGKVFIGIAGVLY